VHVRDVARGHILAAQRGRPGERYVLGHQNLTLLEIFQVLARLTGLAAPRFRVPYAVAWLAAAGMEGVARLVGGTPAVPLTAVRMARKRMFFSVDKAVRELGLPQTPAERALGDAVEWFVSRGYAPDPRRRRAA
jgi:dihydroflavonol-4-reductase